MLRLLLDEHLSRILAEQLRRTRPELDLQLLADWHDGAYLGVPDAEVLEAAVTEGRTLVSYDKRTLVPLLKVWGEAGKSHSGVVLISAHSIPPNDIGTLLRTLCALWDAQGQLDWTDRVLYLSS